MAIFHIKRPSSRQGAVQNIATGAASVQLPTKFGPETYQVRLSCTAACFYVITENANPVAASASNGALLNPGPAEYVTVTPGQTLTEIQQSAAGVLSVTEVS